jgi:Fe-S-cluster containining protein
VWVSAKGGLRFECTGCGGCCTARGEYAHVYLNRDELRQLADHFALTTAEFRKRYTFKDDEGYTQLRFHDQTCVFLERGTQRCTVYPARPTQCRTFPFWRGMIDKGRFTAEARELCEGIGRGPIVSADEAEVRMREMELADED